MRKCIIVILYFILLAYTKRPAVAASGLLSVEPVPAPAAPSANHSANPELRVNPAARNWPAARPPVWQPLLPMVDGPQSIVEFDPKQRREFTLPLPETAGTNSPDQAPPFEGALPPGIGAESVIGVDGRVRVGDTASYPWRTLCKLFITAADGSGWIGSGAIIGRGDGNSFHVLTAGHCVYMHDHGGWVSSIEVIPGYDDGYMPFNHAYATYYRSYTGWTTSAQPDHDWAVVTLDRGVGYYTGWMGRITRGTSDAMYTGTLNSSGYPGDLCAGHCQYYDSDTGRSASEYKHHYNMDTAGGQSGMPVWVYYSTGTDPAPGRYISTVHAYGDGGAGNSGTRLNSDKFDRINTWINSDAPPLDRPDLMDDGDSFSSFNPYSVTAGTTTFSVQCRVRNAGTAASGAFRVRFYASANTTISSGDYLIAESSQSSLAAFSYRSVLATVTFPAGIPAGSYYIGWIVDADSTVLEFVESNNSAYKAAPRLAVSAPAVPDIRITPTSLSFAGTAMAAEAVEAPVKAAAGAAAAMSPAAGNQKLIDAPQVMSQFVKSPKARVIVNLRPAMEAQAAVNFQSAPEMHAWQATVAGLQAEVKSRVPARDMSIRRQFENVPGFSAEVTWEGLQALLAHPSVSSVEPVYEVEVHLAQGVPLIGGLTHRSQYDGSGVAIAVCDTGVDYNHPRLGGGGFPNSKVLGGYDFGDGDANPAPNGHGHGTACAGIAAGALGTVGDYIGGVAPGAKIYALKISTGTSGSATTDAMVAAWDWCVSHRNDNPNYPILAISTSFGGGRYTATCDSAVPSMTAAVNNAIAAGITVLASSGNNGYCDSLAWPACISGVISVGAVYDGGFGNYLPCVDGASCAPKTASGGCTTGYYATDATAADKVTSYCNVAPFLTLMAPGNRCATLDISSSGGYSTGDYTDTFGGTSAACPYVAGAVASLQMAAKLRTGRYLTVAEVKAKLLSTGDNVTDTKTPITKPRINVARAIDTLDGASLRQTFRIANDGSGSLTVQAITPETAAPWLTVSPSGGFSIPAGGSQEVTVTINLSLVTSGQASTRLIVTSNDPDESPYPNAVYIQVTPAAPAHDAFANRAMLSGYLVRASASNAGATRETGEPLHDGNSGGHSVWYSWTATVNGPVRVTTDGSSFDTLLAVYTGTSVGGLTLVDSDDDAGAGVNSLLTFYARAGTVYQIAVDGYSGATGTIQLTLQVLPPLRMQTPQILANGTRRIWMASGDQEALDSTRLPKVQVLTSTDINRPTSQWTPLVNSIGIQNGMFYVDDAAIAGQVKKFYRAVENP